MKNKIKKTKNFFVEHKRSIISLSLMLLALVAISLISLALLTAFKVIYFVEGEMHFNEELFISFRSKWYGWVIFILLQTILSIFLCAIPGASMAFILLCQTIYPVPWQAFIVSFSSVMISSTVMYTIGKLGGYKLVVKLLGVEDCKKSLGLLRNRGTIYFPLMMMFPVFPDDALVMIAGVIRMKLSWFIPSVAIGRGIGTATIIFGLAIIPFENFTTIWHWVLFVIACLFLLAIVFFVANKLNNMFEKRRKRIMEEVIARRNKKKEEEKSENA